MSLQRGSWVDNVRDFAESRAGKHEFDLLEDTHGMFIRWSTIEHIGTENEDIVFHKEYLPMNLQPHDEAYYDETPENTS